MTDSVSQFIGGPTDRYCPTEIPSGWKWVRLTDVADLQTGHTPDRKVPEYWDGGISWVSLQDTGDLDRSEIARTACNVSEAGLANSSARLLPKGTVIFSRTATVGKSTVLGSSMATSQDFMNYVCGEQVCNTYLMHAFRGMAKTWNSLMAGSTFSTIYKPDFANLRLLLPPKSEQERIASLLSIWDQSIELTECLLFAKDRRRLWLMKKLVAGRVRLKGHSGKWRKIALGDVSTMSSGGTPSKQNPKYWDGEVPWVSAKDLKSFVLNGSIDHVTNEAIGNGTRLVETGSILILVRGMTLLKSVPVCVAGVPMCFNQDIRVIKASHEVDERFLAYSIAASEQRLLSYVNVSGHGTGRLATDTLKELPLRIPPTRAEQISIRDLLDSCVKELAILRSKVALLKRQKKGLMQQLLTGKTRVKLPKGAA